MRALQPLALTALVLAATTALGIAQGRAVKFHVTLGGGPHAGTYDVASEACDAGLHKPGSWNALWQDDTAGKGKLSSVLVGIDPKPFFGSGITAVVEFGGDRHKVLYEIQQAKPTITDRGKTATLTFTGKARVADYETGNFEDGGEAEIKIECGKVARY
jgi:hypothetical protein